MPKCPGGTAIIFGQSAPSWKPRPTAYSPSAGPGGLPCRLFALRTPSFGRFLNRDCTGNRLRRDLLHHDGCRQRAGADY